MTRGKKWLLGGVGIVVAAVAIFTGIVALAFRDRGTPPILGQVECDNHDCEKHGDEFRTILSNRFAVGTSAVAMEQILTRQGFEHSDFQPTKCVRSGDEVRDGEGYVGCPAWDQNWNPRNELLYSWGVFPCGNVVGLQWSEDGSGRIKHLESYYHYGCL